MLRIENVTRGANYSIAVLGLHSSADYLLAVSVEVSAAPAPPPTPTPVPSSTPVAPTAAPTTNPPPPPPAEAASSPLKTGLIVGLSVAAVAAFAFAARHYRRDAAALCGERCACWRRDDSTADDDSEMYQQLPADYRIGQ